MLSWERGLVGGVLRSYCSYTLKLGSFQPAFRKVPKTLSPQFPNHLPSSCSLSRREMGEVPCNGHKGFQHVGVSREKPSMFPTVDPSEPPSPICQSYSSYSSFATPAEVPYFDKYRKKALKVHASATHKASIMQACLRKFLHGFFPVGECNQPPRQDFGQG